MIINGNRARFATANYCEDGNVYIEYRTTLSSRLRTFAVDPADLEDKIDSGTVWEIDNLGRDVLIHLIRFENADEMETFEKDARRAIFEYDEANYRFGLPC